MSMPHSRARAILVWAVITVAVSVPVAASVASPLLAWRDPVYIAAGIAGVLALAVMPLQPLLAGGYLPGLSARRRRNLHRAIGTGLVAAVVLHVAGLWITSPPDVVDALLFASPAPFAVWGVLSMWALFATAAVVAFRRRLHLPAHVWRMIHTALAAIIVVGSVVHAWLIDGTMEPISKIALCVIALAASVKAMVDLRVWTARRKRQTWNDRSAGFWDRETN